MKANFKPFWHIQVDSTNTKPEQMSGLLKSPQLCLIVRGSSCQMGLVGSAEHLIRMNQCFIVIRGFISAGLTVQGMMRLLGNLPKVG